MGMKENKKITADEAQKMKNAVNSMVNDMVDKLVAHAKEINKDKK